MNRDAEGAKKYTISAGGMSVSVTDYGATVLGICVPAADGSVRDVALGYDDIGAYREGKCYFGGLIGRNGNRIAGGTFSLNGKTVRMPVNENGNSLHSGPDGYERRIWKVESQAPDAIVFSLHSPDGDQGLPGNLDIRVTYRMTADGTFSLTYEGISDADTIFNPTNHTYFNLDGHDSGSILDQLLMLSSSAFSEITADAIPTGRHLDTAGTAFDFRTFRPIGERIGGDEEQLRRGGGYDHNFFADGTPGEFRRIAEARSLSSGIRMEVFTDLPCVQFYAGNYVEGKGKGGVSYGPRSGFCLETQYCPDAVNRPGELQPFLKAGVPVCSRTSYKFGIC